MPVCLPVCIPLCCTCTRLYLSASLPAPFKPVRLLFPRSCLSACRFVYLSAMCTRLFLSASLLEHICLSACPPAGLSTSLMFVYLSVSLPFLSACLPARLPVCLPLCCTFTRLFLSSSPLYLSACLRSRVIHYPGQPVLPVADTFHFHHFNRYSLDPYNHSWRKNHSRRL